MTTLIDQAQELLEQRKRIDRMLAEVVVKLGIKLRSPAPARPRRSPRRRRPPAGAGPADIAPSANASGNGSANGNGNAIATERPARSPGVKRLIGAATTGTRRNNRAVHASPERDAPAAGGDDPEEV